MALTGVSANRLELLQIADAVAREKSIEKEIVIAAIEEAIQKAARARYGAEHDIRVHIDPRTGETTVKRVQTVADPVENEDTELSLDEGLALELAEFKQITGGVLVQSADRIDADRAQQVQLVVQPQCLG